MSTTTPRDTYEAQQALKLARVARLQAMHPELIALVENGNALTTAAKNIRIELKAAFAAVKFSVKTSRFAGGDSIDVSWTDGPTSAQVDAIIGKYKAGSFDGMTDSYDYSDATWIRAFGDGMFVHSSRRVSPELRARIVARVCARFGIAMPSADEIARGNYYAHDKNGIDLSREVHIATSRHTCAIAKTLIARDDKRPAPTLAPTLRLVQ